MHQLKKYMPAVLLVMTFGLGFLYGNRVQADGIFYMFKAIVYLAAVIVAWELIAVQIENRRRRKQEELEWQIKKARAALEPWVKAFKEKYKQIPETRSFKEKLDAARQFPPNQKLSSLGMETVTTSVGRAAAIGMPVNARPQDISRSLAKMNRHMVYSSSPDVTEDGQIALPTGSYGLYGLTRPSTILRTGLAAFLPATALTLPTRSNSHKPTTRRCHNGEQGKGQADQDGSPAGVGRDALEPVHVPDGAAFRGLVEDARAQGPCPAEGWSAMKGNAIRNGQARTRNLVPTKRKKGDTRCETKAEARLRRRIKEHEALPHTNDHGKCGVNGTDQHRPGSFNK